MNVKDPNFVGLKITAARGATIALEGTALLRQTEYIPILLEQGIEVLPGQETAVIIALPGIPQNAKFNRLTGKIKFWAPTEGAKFTVAGALEKPYAQEVSNTLSVAATKSPELRNAKLRLADGEVFWFQPGPIGLKTSPTALDLPDFASPANQSLETHPPQDGKLLLTFLVQSDTPARVDIVINPADYDIVLLQTKTWENELDDTLRFDRNLDLNFCSIERLELDRAKSNDYPRLQSIRFDLAGQPDAPRVLASIETHDEREFAIVSSQFSIAQEVRPAFPLKCTGISVCLRAASEAELYLEVRDDLPSGSSRTDPKGKASVKLTPSGDHAPAWVFAPLEPEITFEGGRPCWIILRGIRGVVHLATVSGDITASITPSSDETAKEQAALRLLVNRGGQLWKPFRRPSDRPSALLRLIYLPDADHQTAAVELGLMLESVPAKSQRADISIRPQSVRFDLADDNIRLGPGDVLQLVIKSHMRGELTLANLVQEFAK